MKIFGEKGNQATLFFAGIFLVLSSLIIFDDSNTDAQVRTVQDVTIVENASLSDFRKLAQAVRQNNDEVKNNTRLLQQLQREVKKIKDDLYTMAKAISENREQGKNSTSR